MPAYPNSGVDDAHAMSTMAGYFIRINVDSVPAKLPPKATTGLDSALYVWRTCVTMLA
eukprot:m.897651 g.897651  ORF g.897651 m.897651 type:complete len:58 (+) comp23669_c0_seq45:3000-3173(+)